MRIDLDSTNVLPSTWNREVSPSNGLHDQKKIQSAFSSCYTGWSHKMTSENSLDGRASIGAKGPAFHLAPPQA